MLTVGKNTVVGCHWMTVRFPSPPPPPLRQNACIERIYSTSKIAFYFDVATLKRREPLCFSIHERSYYSKRRCIASRCLYSNFPLSLSFSLDVLFYFIFYLNLTRIGKCEKCIHYYHSFILFLLLYLIIINI